MPERCHKYDLGAFSDSFSDVEVRKKCNACNCDSLWRLAGTGRDLSYERKLHDGNCLSHGQNVVNFHKD